MAPSALEFGLKQQHRQETQPEHFSSCFVFFEDLQPGAYITHTLSNQQVLIRQISAVAFLSALAGCCLVSPAPQRGESGEMAETEKAGGVKSPAPEGVSPSKVVSLKSWLVLSI